MDISSVAPEQLDEIVYDVACNQATEAMNQTDCEDQQEEILNNAEANASDINNRGVESQIGFLKSNGLSEMDILKAIA